MTYHFYAVHNGKIYKEMVYGGYTKRQAIKLYKAKYGLKGRHNVKLYNAIGGKPFK